MVECISHEVLHLGFKCRGLKDDYSEVFWTRKRNNCANVLVFFIKQLYVTVGIMMYRRDNEKINLFNSEFILVSTTLENFFRTVILIVLMMMVKCPLFSSLMRTKLDSNLRLDNLLYPPVAIECNNAFYGHKFK